MSAHTVKPIVLSETEHKALTALLNGGITHAALEKLGLLELASNLRLQYAGIYDQVNSPKPELGRLDDYGVFGIIK